MKLTLLRVNTSAVFKQFNALTDNPNSVIQFLTIVAYVEYLHQNHQQQLPLN